MPENILKEDENRRNFIQKGGGRAFPTTKPLDGWGDPDGGMTLRDWFAGQALAGLLASPRGPADGAAMTDKLAASLSYTMADAMLAERDK